MQNKYSFYIGLLKVLNFRRILNFLIIEISYFFSKLTGIVIVFGKPWSAAIEPTTSCNLGCRECPTGMKLLTREKGSISLEAFNAILNKLSPELIYLTLYFQGEPFLNPQLSELVKIAKQKRIFVTTSTNGHFLSGNNSKSFIQSGLDHLIISLDGLDQETYSKYRVNGNFQAVIDGIQQLVEEKKQLKSATPYIELQFLVFRHNEHQLIQMKEFARHLKVDKLSFKTAQIYNFDKAVNIVPSLKKMSRYRHNTDGDWVPVKKIYNRCHRIWRSVVITWNGDVVPCCYDKNATYSMGNLTESTFTSIWKNAGYHAFRKNILVNRKSIDICRNCDE